MRSFYLIILAFIKNWTEKHSMYICWPFISSWRDKGCGLKHSNINYAYKSTEFHLFNTKNVAECVYFGFLGVWNPSLPSESGQFLCGSIFKLSWGPLTYANDSRFSNPLGTVKITSEKESIKLGVNLIS